MGFKNDDIANNPDYFKLPQIELEDGSDFEIAEILIKLYEELKDKNEKLLNGLIQRQNKLNIKYSIEFPFTGKQVPPPKKKEEDSEEDEGEEEEDEKDENKKEEKKENKINDDNKMQIDEPDEDGFVVVRKGKKGF